MPMMMRLVRFPSRLIHPSNIDTPGNQLDMNTQGSSHWDGLRHYPYQDSLLYYNGVTQDDISGVAANTKIGIQSK